MLFTLNTTVFISPEPGADITTFLAPALICFSAFSLEVKNPVHSKTTSTPNCPHGKFSGSASAKVLISFPFTTNAFSLTWISPSNLPCAVSYLNKCANIAASVKSLIATTSNSGSFAINLNANLPILPNPLIATLTAILLLPPKKFYYFIHNLSISQII